MGSLSVSSAIWIFSEMVLSLLTRISLETFAADDLASISS